ncbi:mechanosensitive ion channel domain-containing protein [Methylomarinovum tepidoasis]|uniref:mechanosensitive ion channel domain-containing protein n=1 Tax=Methylomarinovum tepidoasis TaxID=2840183 RepID=UPI0025748F8C|nr:mechanosensitive ion channel domain-containing protein [Methylomarinovum sp. IN45]
MALFLLFVLAGSGWGTPQAPDAARIEALRQTIESSTLEEKDRKQALEWLGQAQQWLQQAQAAKAAQEEIRRQVRNAPQRLKTLEHRIAHPESLTHHWPPLKPTQPLAKLEVQLAEEEAALARAEERLRQQEQRLADLLEAAATGSQQITDLERQQQEVNQELATLPETSTAPLQRARRLSLKARLQWLQAELARLRLRQTHLTLLTRLARAERNLLAMEVDLRRKRVETLRRHAQLAREHQVFGASREAAVALKTVEPEIRPFLEKNLQFWNELKHLMEEDERLGRKIQEIKRRLDELRQDFDHIRQAIELAGTDEKLAEQLYHRLRTLPTLDTFHRETLQRHAHLKQAVVRRFEIEEALRRLRDTDTVVADRLQRLPEDLPANQRMLLRVQLREAVTNRRKALQALQQEYTRHIRLLSELDALAQRYYEQVQSYRHFLQRQLLWIPARKLFLQPSTLLTAIADVLDPAHLQTVARSLVRTLRQDPLPPASTVALALTLLGLRSWLYRDLQQLGLTTRSVRSDRFLNTLRAFGDTLLLAAPPPLLLSGLGWWLRRHAFTDPALTDLAGGLLLASRPAFTLGVLRQICRPEGLAVRHLRWLQVTREQLWRQLGWFYGWAVLCTFVIGATGSPSLTPLSLGLGRLTFMALMVSIAFMIWRLWRRHGPILEQLAKSRPSWVVNYHSLWFPLALAVPLGLGLLALLGYYYAAFYLAEKAFRTFWTFVFLVILKDLLLRWLHLTERRLRYQEILRRREAQHAEAGGELPPVEEPEVDFVRLSEQTRRLFDIAFFSAAFIGLWIVWRDAVPVLNVLEQVTLPMHTVRTIGGVPKEVPLTLADLVTGILLGLLTMLAARNLPGLLEFAVLRYLPLSQGTRYAWSALTQYLIAALGIYLIFRALGVQWSEIQWLIAALSVGLGFGLQEVVANFVSGLILLFEQPIRVGDVVTIGDVTGTVSRIRIRATTILNWDRQELVIPNKNFITGAFINWTLTDTTNRIVIQIGVSYGCDVEKAMRIVMEVAKSHPEVLDDPSPLVTFENFGDNSLLLILRAYLGTLDNRLSTITDLHRQIYQRLGEAGIEIAFPQRDVHLDSKGPLQVVVRQADTGGSAG